MNYFALCAALCSLNAFASQNNTRHFSFRNHSNEAISINYGQKGRDLPGMGLITFDTDCTEPIVATWKNPQAGDCHTALSTKFNNNDYVFFSTLAVIENGKKPRCLHQDTEQLTISSDQ